jgi:hypothetical protein
MLTALTLLAQANFGGVGLKEPTDAFSLGSSAENGVRAATNFEQFISNMIGFVTVVAGLMFVVYFLQAAIAWIGANGEASKVLKARDQIVNATVGIIVLIASYAVAGLIGTVFGIQLLRPGASILNLNPLKNTGSDKVINDTIIQPGVNARPQIPQ